MSVESYFFASFQDNERAFNAIQQRLDARPPEELPRAPSDQSLRTLADNAAENEVLIDNSGSSGLLGLKKIGSVLKPLIPSKSDKPDDTDTSDGKSGISIPFLKKSHKASHDSLETLRTESVSEQHEEDSDGYPPKQNGVPPQGMQGDSGKKWSGWIRKPANKIFGTSPIQPSLQTDSPPDTQLGAGLTDTPSRTANANAATIRSGGSKRASVTEIVESAVPGNASDESDDDYQTRRQRKRSDGDARVSFASQSTSGSQLTHTPSEYSMMEESESGNREEAEIAKKFRNVFSLGEKEQLIERGFFKLSYSLHQSSADFPGYLYRVLPVSGRFFVSTNYFCFRSSQLLYKTKVSRDVNSYMVAHLRR